MGAPGAAGGGGERELPVSEWLWHSAVLNAMQLTCRRVQWCR